MLLVAGLMPTTAAAPAARKDNDSMVSRFGSSVSRHGNEDYPAAMDRIARNYGKPGVVRIFNSGLPSAWSSIRHNLGADTPLVVSFKADPAEVVSGAHDDYLRAWFADAPTRRRTFWTYYHEPEDNIANGEFSASDYRAAWAHLAQLAREAGNPRLRATLILMTWTLNPSAHRDWRDYYAPGAIDVLGWDGYNPYETQGRYATPRQMFQRAYRIARAQGLPWGIAEFGSQLAAGDSGSGRAAWLLACADYLAARDARFVTYFDAAFDGENDFRLLDGASRGAWRSVVSAG